MQIETFEALSERRHELIRVVRGGADHRFERAINEASADDLEWLTERLETQLTQRLDDIPDVNERAYMHERTRDQLIVVRGVLGNKRTIEKSEQARSAQRQTTIATWTAIVSAVTSVAAIILSIIALMRSGP